jgi:ADP-ribose pyrophosphatase YjhB (NUDIX family)
MKIPEELYQQFCRCMPVACVDVLVVDGAGRVLLLRRRNHPALGQWWFPGGRVLHLETRRQAALRKLHEECGIQAASAKEVGTYDVILEDPERGVPHHGITTVYVVRVDSAAPINLDGQSAACAWRSPEAWRREPLHEFVRMGLTHLEQLPR